MGPGRGARRQPVPPGEVMRIGRARDRIALGADRARGVRRKCGRRVDAARLRLHRHTRGGAEAGPAGGRDRRPLAGRRPRRALRRLLDQRDAPRRPPGHRHRRTRGVIRDLLVEEGDRVEANQPLAHLEDDRRRSSSSAHRPRGTTPPASSNGRARCASRSSSARRTTRSCSAARRSRGTTPTSPS